MPKTYLNRGEIVVQVDGQVYRGVQQVYLDQMGQLVALRERSPSVIGNIRVDGDNTLSTAIFNTPDGSPRTDYKVFHGPQEDDFFPTEP